MKDIDPGIAMTSSSVMSVPEHFGDPVLTELRFGHLVDPVEHEVSFVRLRRPNKQ
jgi:hypothetical protein